MLTKCLARVLGPEITVNSIAPGTIQFEGEAPDTDFIQRVPLHRVGTGDDIAEAAAWIIGLPPHMNINRMEIMPTCQAPGPLTIKRS